MKLKTLSAAMAMSAGALMTTNVHAADPVSLSAQLCGATACVPIPPALALAVIAAPVVIGNVQAAGNESGAGAQALRATLGVSVRDMEKYGIWGGPNSFFRCPFGGC